MSSVSHNLIKHKVGLLNLAAELGNVSRACKVMGLSRDTFYRYQSAMQSGGIDALIDANRKKPNLRNRVESATEPAVTDFANEQPAFGQVRVSNELRKRGAIVSPSDVEIAPFSGLKPNFVAIIISLRNGSRASPTNCSFVYGP